MEGIIMNKQNIWKKCTLVFLSLVLLFSTSKMGVFAQYDEVKENKDLSVGINRLIDDQLNEELLTFEIETHSESPISNVEFFSGEEKLQKDDLDVFYYTVTENKESTFVVKYTKEHVERSVQEDGEELKVYITEEEEFLFTVDTNQLTEADRKQEEHAEEHIENSDVLDERLFDSNEQEDEKNFSEPTNRMSVEASNWTQFANYYNDPNVKNINVTGNIVSTSQPQLKDRSRSLTIDGNGYTYSGVATLPIGAHAISGDKSFVVNGLNLNMTNTFIKVNNSAWELVVFNMNNRNGKSKTEARGGMLVDSARDSKVILRIFENFTYTNSESEFISSTQQIDIVDTKLDVYATAGHGGFQFTEGQILDTQGTMDTDTTVIDSTFSGDIYTTECVLEMRILK